MSPTLGAYIARRFFGTAAGSFLGVFFLIFVIHLVELLRKNSQGIASFADLVGMALLHAPTVTLTVAPFTMLLAALTCFAMLARSSELVVTRAVGVSVWQLLLPAGAVALALGVFIVTAFNPLAAAFAKRYEALEVTYFDPGSSSMAFAGGGLWLRQGGKLGQTVIRAKGASGTGERLWSVSVFEFGTGDRLVKRIEARSAVLEPGAWRLHGVRSWQLVNLDIQSPQRSERVTRPTRSETLRIPTDLTPERIQESFAPPRTISFWQLPGFIALLEHAGFNAARHRLHWEGLLALPVVFVAMLLIGAGFAMRHARLGGAGYRALACVLAGFTYFFLSDLATALGSSGAVPVLIAAWAPPVSAVMFALGLLLHLEDG